MRIRLLMLIIVAGFLGACDRRLPTVATATAPASSQSKSGSPDQLWKVLGAVAVPSGVARVNDAGTHIAMVVSEAEGLVVVRELAGATWDGLKWKRERIKGRAVEPESLRISADGKRWAIIRYVGDEETGPRCVVVDGVAGPEFSAIWDESLVFSPDGKHVAYAASGKEGAVMMVDGKQVDQFATLVVELDPGVGVRRPAVVFSPDGKRMAYVVRRFIDNTGRLSEQVVVDGTSRPWGQVSPRSLTFSADSRHVAYVAGDGPRGTAGVKHQVIIDGETKGTFGFVEPTSLVFPGFPADGNRLVFVAAEPDSRGEYFVVDDGKPSARWARVANVTVSADGKRVAYAAYTKGEGNKIGEPSVLVNGDALCEGAFRAVLSADGKRVACVRGVRDVRFPYGLGNQVVVDGRADDAVARVGNVIFTGDGKHYAYDVPGGVGMTSGLVVDGEFFRPPTGVAFVRMRFAGRLIDAVTISGGGDRADVYERVEFNMEATGRWAPEEK